MSALEFPAAYGERIRLALADVSRGGDGEMGGSGPLGESASDGPLARPRDIRGLVNGRRGRAPDHVDLPLRGRVEHPRPVTIEGHGLLDARLAEIVEMFDPAVDADRARGRRAVRDAVLRMRPIDRAAPALKLPRPHKDGVFWGVTAENGLTVALRARNLLTARAADEDARRILTHPTQFDLIWVHNPGTAEHSLWVAAGGIILFVAGQVWRQPNSVAERAVLKGLCSVGRDEMSADGLADC
ncbi:hypothetical protein [uncultured Microbacterium sp.]|uniref:hypothetical protein n=1 Tax=uncultured Microbacterium sp. TaxID=191216 RepID=UPI0035CB70E3